MIVYEVEELTDELIEEITPILELHRVELQSHEMKLNPDWDAYKRVQDAGKFMWLIARDATGTIVGYTAFVISNNLHYKDFIYAIEDVFYVVEDKRGRRIGATLVKRSEELLKERGVDVITHHAKFTNRFSQFLQKLGYAKTETMLAKKIS